MANSEYRGSASNSVAGKKSATSKSKTVATPGTKVSQSTIDKIKSMGMSAALKSAKSASPEMREGIRRLYGASRYNAAVAGTGRSAAASSADAARARAGMGRASKGMTETAPGTRSSKPKLGANTVMAPSNPNRQNMPYKTPGAKPVQKDMYGNKVKSNVTIGAKKKAASTPSKSKSGYKAPTQKDMYGNKIK